MLCHFSFNNGVGAYILLCCLWINSYLDWCRLILFVFNAILSVSHAPQTSTGVHRKAPVLNFYSVITWTHTHTHIKHTLAETNTIPRRLFPEWRCQSEITMTGCRVEMCVCVWVLSQKTHTKTGGPDWIPSLVISNCLGEGWRSVVAKKRSARTEQLSF